VSPRGESPLYPKQVLTPGRDDGRLSRAAGSADLVLDTWRRRPWPRRLLKALAIVLLLAGATLIAYPFATNIYANYRQGSLAREFRSESTERRYVTRTVRTGQALTRLRIPELGVDTIVVEGTTLSALRAGAGHYEATALPCEGGNAAIAGHRTTYSKPFARLDQLRTGDRIEIETPLGECTYRVTGAPFVVEPDDWRVIAATGGATLTLTTCHPPGSAAQRLVVRAGLIGEPLR